MQTGDTVGKYKLERMLGRGGMGEVWAAHDPDLDRRVAIKVVRGALAGSDDARARLQREGPDVISLVIRPAFGLGLNAVGWIVVFPGSKPPSTPADLAVALRAAPAIAVSEVYPASSSVVPDAQASDGYATLTRPAAGDIVMCAIHDADPLGYIASILGATKPPVCHVLAANAKLPAILESSR